MTADWKARRAADFARKASHTECKGCGRRILTGLDADVCAFSVTVDASPVDAEGEHSALTKGLRTYDLAGDCLWRRLDRHIAADPKYDIHVAHRCARSEQLEII
jgi:hypothetical protein